MVHPAPPQLSIIPASRPSNAPRGPAFAQPKQAAVIKMVKTKEAKPPAEVVEAIQQSNDGSTAPLSAEVLGDLAATRPIAAKLVHEEPQRPSQLPEEMRHGDAHGNPHQPGPMSSQDKKMLFEEAQAQQQAEQRYDRSHPGAGHAGAGDQQIDSMMGVARDARKQ